MFAARLCHALIKAANYLEVRRLFTDGAMESGKPVPEEFKNSISRSLSTHQNLARPLKAAADQRSKVDQDANGK